MVTYRNKKDVLQENIFATCANVFKIDNIVLATKTMLHATTDVFLADTSINNVVTLANATTLANALADITTMLHVTTDVFLADTSVINIVTLANAITLANAFRQTIVVSK